MINTTTLQGPGWLMFFRRTVPEKGGPGEGLPISDKELQDEEEIMAVIMRFMTDATSRLH